MLSLKAVSKFHPIPKFKILGQAELASLRSEPTLPLATHGKESKGHENGLRMNGDINKDWHQAIVNNDWLKLERPKGGLFQQIALLSTYLSLIFRKYVRRKVHRHGS